MIEGRWSLTRRLALRFALLTSALLALHWLGSSYVLYSALRDDVRDFLLHEEAEFAALIDGTDGSPAALQQATDQIARLTEPMPCAFRVLERQGFVVAEAGSESLLSSKLVHDVDARGPHPLWLLDSPFFLRRGVAQSHGLEVAVLVDATENQRALIKYLLSAGGVLLLFVGLAAVSAWLMAWRSLDSLRQLTAQARQISGPAHGSPLRLRDAPIELSELAGELNAMLDRIDESMRSIKTFTAGLAHELRSPLQNLMGEIDVALLSARSTQDYEHLLRSNLDDLHALSDAVDNLIAWCRSAEPDPRRRPPEHFDLAQEARLRLERERRTAERGGLLLALDSQGDTQLLANREDSLRVLRNLVGNAIAWSPAGTTIEVHIEGDEQGVRVAVDDRGPGIPPELADRIFEPFVTGRPRKGERGGYGLGLAICRSIMQEHGGSLGFESRAGGGTRFLARFPRERRAA